MKKITHIFRSLLAAGIAFSFLAGCATDQQNRRTAGQYLDDQTLNARVKSALLGEDEVPGRDVSTTTLDGVVQLSGFVDSMDERERAEEVTRSVPGVQEVQNNIELNPRSRQYGEPGERQEQPPQSPEEEEWEEDEPQSPQPDEADSSEPAGETRY